MEKSFISQKIGKMASKITKSNMIATLLSELLIEFQAI